ncbi:hypothetical protein HMF8227_00038 [Saliniradius amylolyticus]|uniref:DUF2785 domain-containing protein n=1 Tax=Saliniradius amylolyticus TaxID=2183582 RepID=A0A2S2DYU9_9ALTE|nr:DUF2785 domain-containing protein [Saliniradius amylolyticus]AWL10546.1 hypothetical protein HMF8227_00038 [Saliniradius amylolyticus]
MKAIFLLTTLLCSWPVFASSVSEKQCLKDWGGKAQLQELQTANFRLEDATPEQLLGMRHCLASKSPVIRDQIAYQAFYTWLREGVLPQEIKRTLATLLISDIQHRRSDPRNVYLPFAVLVLSEVVRADGVSPFLSSQERRDYATKFSEYVKSISDYRGYDDTMGWRHQVAHSADVVLQMIVSPHFGTETKLHMLDALATQISPEGHFYHFGEPKRIARAVAYAMMMLPADSVDWEVWLISISQPFPYKDWETTYTSEAGLSKRHNTVAFLQSLLVYTHQAEELTQYQTLVMDRLITMR